MNDTLHLRDLARPMRRLWWIPLLLALAGLSAGLTAPTQVATVYRAQATVLVGPTEGAVTHTSTVRTSENLASFYADLARRQIILDPVAQELGTGQSWVQVRNRVKAVVPPENLRLVTVTVMGDTQEQADVLANELVRELVSLSPALPGGNGQAFINEQAEGLKQTIRDTQDDIDRLETEEAAATTPEVERALREEARTLQDRLVSQQRAYVELIAAEPTSDAGGLTVIDEASAVTDLGRPDPAKQALVGAALGAAVGMVLVWWLHRRGRRRDAGSAPEAVSTAPAAPAGTRGRPSATHDDAEGGAPGTASPVLPHGRGARRSERLAGSRRRTPRTADAAAPGTRGSA